jgi:divalent metal cation (Fe/Co/Zn/Cd) transporter
LLSTAGALAVCLLAVAGFMEDASSVDRSGTPDPHRTLLALAEQPAQVFIIVLGCLATVSAAAGVRRRKSSALDDLQIKQLAAQARTDSLTSLGNHRAFEERACPRRSPRARPPVHPLSCSRSTSTD